MNALADYAVNESRSRGRQNPEPPHAYRDAFERDRDRIIHCAAFRRLEGKSQVFTTGLNDAYRTRLTHSIEVAQIGRTLARCLQVNETLTEAICLGHDLGHSPFGHNGEKVLNELTLDIGGFEHNRQALRIVDRIECPYPGWRGLNLMYETRLGFMKHSSPYDHPMLENAPVGSNCLEGRIADLADRIAYNCHDLEDGLRSRLIDENQLAKLTLYRQVCDKVQVGRIEDRVIRRTRISKALIDLLAVDAIETSKSRLESAGIDSLEKVYRTPEPLVGLSRPVEESLLELEHFLMESMYLHPMLQETAKNVRVWLTRLFEHLCKEPGKMPPHYQQQTATEGLERTVCDYVAGMTDRYCMKCAQEILSQAQ
ncbi:MAG: deoxyguanosinetriphosphate triphosphohydrolase [Planctomycetaceae bacterium]|nr:deoxyguanosinetriphosphate triphosphohydrolase [Planctomycetaceae bacterium]